MRFTTFVGLAGIGLLILTGCEKKTPPPQPPPSVTVTPVKAGTVTPNSTIIAQVKAYNDVKLVARVKGFLRKQDFVEGQMVKKDQLLYLIEPEEYQADVQSAEAMLLRAQADQKNANIDYVRQKNLYTQDAVSQRNYDNAVAKKMECDAAILQATAKLENAKLNLSYTEIKSPFTGRIGLNTYSVGNVVGPDSGTLADVVQVDQVRVQFSLNELLLLKIMQYRGESGNAPELTVKLFFQDGSMYKYPGAITFWNNRINPATGSLLMQATFPNPEMLLVPGMYVKVTLETKHPEKALLAPLNAILDSQAGKSVMLVNKDSVVEERKITTGDSDGPYIQITSGLKAGDLIIVEGLQKVRSGLKVAITVDKNFGGVDVAASPVPAAPEQPVQPPPANSAEGKNQENLPVSPPKAKEAAANNAIPAINNEKRGRR
ncbi:MAG: efflux RND transporter periplasmic adaptor subunit [Victivallaceae bacterium]